MQQRAEHVGLAQGLGCHPLLLSLLAPLLFVILGPHLLAPLLALALALLAGCSHHGGILGIGPGLKGGIGLATSPLAFGQLQGPQLVSGGGNRRHGWHGLGAQSLAAGARSGWTGRQRGGAWRGQRFALGGGEGREEEKEGERGC